MKNMFKSALVACMALAIGLVGCQNNGVVDGPEKGSKSVVIKIAKDKATRAAVAPLDADGETEAVVFATGSLYFAAGDDIVKIVNILSDEDYTTDDEDDNNVLLSTLQSELGKTFSNLPAAIDAVHFAANLPDDDYDFATIEDLEEVALDLEALSDIDAIAIYGKDTELEGPIVQAGENDLYNAVINARPVAARFEISSIAAETTDPEIPAIASFDLVGIYLDNIYLSVELGGTAVGDVQGGEIIADAQNTEINLLDYPYPAAWHIADYTKDVFTDKTDGTEYTAGTDLVWGYNLPAPGSIDPDDATVFNGVATLPYIVIKLANVELENGTELGTKFLTLEQKVADGEEAIKLEQGKVYKVKDFTFNASDLTEWPYQAAIDINVQVEIMNWTAEEVEYEFW